MLLLLSAVCCVRFVPTTHTSTRTIYVLYVCSKSDPVSSERGREYETEKHKEGGNGKRERVNAIESVLILMMYWYYFGTKAQQ